MNNYCTNCGEKLEKNDLVCNYCNVPIVDLPYNYYYISPEKKERTRKILTIIVICILCAIAFCFVKIIMSQIKINKMQKKYIEPYLKENYGNSNYSIKYEYSEKCIISGDCYFDPIMVCGGISCQKYTYLDEKDCKSYYYSIKSGTENFILTVVNRNKQFYVVKGRNIYGSDEEYDKEYDEEYDEEYD